MENPIFLSEQTSCPKTPAEVEEAINRFRKSNLIQYTYQVRRGDPKAPMGFDFPIDKMRELVADPACQKIRILFSIDDGELDGDGYLSVVLKAINDSESLIAQQPTKQTKRTRKQVSNNSLPAAPQTTILCCGRPPTG